MRQGQKYQQGRSQSGIAKQREKDQEKKLRKILEGEQIGLYRKNRTKMCLKKWASHWLSAFPLKEARFGLNKVEFGDTIALRYGLPVPNLPDFCACGNEFICDHAMICMTGGFVSLRHNELHDLTGKMLKELCKMWKQNRCFSH